MCCLFPLPTTSYSIRPQYLIFFSFQWFPKLFTDDYLANYMTGVEATKVKVYNSCYHDNALEVFLKAVKDGRAIVTRVWTKVVRAYGMQEGTLWAFASSTPSAVKMIYTCLFTFTAFKYCGSS